MTGLSHDLTHQPQLPSLTLASYRIRGVSDHQAKGNFDQSHGGGPRTVGNPLCYAESQFRLYSKTRLPKIPLLDQLSLVAMAPSSSLHLYFQL